MKAKAPIDLDPMSHKRNLNALQVQHCPMQLLRQIEEVSVESFEIVDMLLKQPEGVFSSMKNVLDTLESIAFGDDVYANLTRHVLNILSTSVGWDAISSSSPWISQVQASEGKYPADLFGRVNTSDEALLLLHYSSSDTFEIQNAFKEIQVSDLVAEDKEIFLDRLIATCCKHRSWSSLKTSSEWRDDFAQFYDMQGAKKYAVDLGFSELLASKVKRKSQIAAFANSMNLYDVDGTMHRVLTQFSHSPLCTETVASALLKGLPFYSFYYHLSEDEIKIYESIKLISLAQDTKSEELFRSIRDYVKHYTFRPIKGDKSSHLRSLKSDIRRKGFEDTTAYLAFAKKAFHENLILKDIDDVEPTPSLPQRKMLSPNEICMRANEHHVTQQLTVQTYKWLQYTGPSKASSTSSTSQAICNAPLRLQSVASLLGYDYAALQQVTDPDQLLWAINSAHALHETIGMTRLVSLHATLQGHFSGVMRMLLKQACNRNAFAMMCKDFLDFSPIHAEGIAMGVSASYLLKMVRQDALIKYNSFYSEAYMLRTIAKGESLKYYTVSSADAPLSMSAEEDNDDVDDTISKTEIGGRISSQSSGNQNETLHLGSMHSSDGVSAHHQSHGKVTEIGAIGIKKDVSGDGPDSKVDQEDYEPVDVLASVDHGWIALKIAKILLYRSFTVDDHYKMQGYLNERAYNYYLHDDFILATALKVDPHKFKILREKYHEDYPMSSVTIGKKNIKVCNENDLNAVIMDALVQEYRCCSFVNSLSSQTVASEDKFIVDYFYTNFYNYLVFISKLDVLIHSQFAMPRYEMIDHKERNSIMILWMDFAKMLMGEYETVCKEYVRDDFQLLAANLPGRSGHVFSPKETRMQEYLEQLGECEKQSALKSTRMQEAVENLQYAILYASPRNKTLSDTQKTILEELFYQHDRVFSHEKIYNNASWQKKVLFRAQKELSAVSELNPNAVYRSKTGFFEGVKRMIYACDPIIDQQTTWREYLQAQVDIVSGALGMKDSLSAFLTKFCIAMNARYYLDKNAHALYALKVCEEYIKASNELLCKVEHAIDEKIKISRSSIFEAEKDWQTLRTQVKKVLPLE